MNRLLDFVVLVDLRDEVKEMFTVVNFIKEYFPKDNNDNYDHIIL